MARPSAIESLTPEQRTRFITLMQTGAPLNWCCEEVGAFTDDTYRKWRLEAKNGNELYVDFIREAEQARHRNAIAHIIAIGKADDWRARAWLLERLHPKEFAPLQKNEHSGPDGAAFAATPVMILPAKEVEEFTPPPPPAPEEAESEDTEDDA